MKRLALLSIPFFLVSPASAADLDYRRYSEPDVYIERPRVVARHYVPAPVIEYYEEEPVYLYSYPYRTFHFGYPYRTFGAYNHWRPHHPRRRHFHGHYRH